VTAALRVALVCACVPALLAIPSVGLAAPGPVAKALLRGKRAFIKQDYERSLKLLQPVVIAPQATISQKIDALELLGLSYLILGDNKRAREAFENLLGLDPAHQLRDPTGSPKLRQFFLAAKERFLPGFDASKRAQLEHRAPRLAKAGRRIELAVQLLSGGAVNTIVVRWRRQGLLTYREVRARARRSREAGSPERGRGWVAAFLLPKDSVGYQLEYYIEGRSKAGHALARLGSPGHPLTLAVGGIARQRGAPFYERWWFWTAVGAALVGGTVAAIALSRERAPEGSLGSITLNQRAGGLGLRF
jgi:tetratricopeptide (TPR) repeat protein